ncbi:NADP-dependent oxidoreductase domain-containing protein [Hygrophoropsis aurantiaca]|uniref:NADP-dependent oxidoreductase domain-containing protein n=1 Tax=Hygrophoropsis aurantiaca TaxID=72124 RepID=A0ACB8AEC1_9AGAM|nr:NADP-dependent oxidoreductase domain-containing protein [Hygrophoropsis aurantiaca]
MSVPGISFNDGHQVPWIAFGTGTALYQQDATEAVKIALENGFTHLDGAQMYNNETTLGAGIVASGKPRSEIFVTTKLTKLQSGQTAKTALEDSLKKLGLQQVDLYLIHSPSHHQGPGRLGQVWKEMEECQSEGLTKSIGVSNFQPQHLKEILEVGSISPAVNQIELHPYVWKSLQSVLDMHAKHGIVTSSYGGLSPLFREKGGPLDPVVEKIRSRLETTRGSPVSDGQVLNKWMQQKKILVVTTSSKPKRIREYLDTINVPDLTPEESDLIETTGSKLHKKFFVSQLRTISSMIVVRLKLTLPSNFDLLVIESQWFRLNFTRGPHHYIVKSLRRKSPIVQWNFFAATKNGV